MIGTNASGQGGATGAISGVVVDTSGGTIAAAEVQIIDARTESTVRKLPTNTDGIFVATLLPPGNYAVVVNKSGFAEARASDIEVRVTETTHVTITLKPRAVSEKMEISAQVTTVETSNAATGQFLGTATVRELPLARQNYQQLPTLSSGAQSDLNAAVQLGRGNAKLFVNGQRRMRLRPAIPRSIRHSTTKPHWRTLTAFRTSIAPIGWSSATATTCRSSKTKPEPRERR